MTKRKLVISFDPGFAHLGYGLIELGATAEGDQLLRCGVIETRKVSTKEHVYAADDNLRRARAICREISSLAGGTTPALVCAEAMSFPRNASAAAKVAMVWGIIAAMAESWSAPVAQISPQGVKRLLCGRADASKQAVEKAVRAELGPAKALLDAEKVVPPSLREHYFDAVAVALALRRDAEIFRAVRCA